MKNKAHIIDNAATTISKKTTTNEYVVQKTHLKGSSPTEMSKEIAAFLSPVAPLFPLFFLFSLSSFLSPSSSPCSSHQQHWPAQLPSLLLHASCRRHQALSWGPLPSLKCNPKPRKIHSPPGPHHQRGSTML